MSRKKLVKAEPGSNHSSTDVLIVDMNKEEMYKKALPKDVVHYVMFECPYDYAFVSVYNAYRKLKSAQKLREWLPKASSAQHAQCYGEGYPRRFV